MTADRSPTGRQMPIELILLRQAASYLSIPVWLADEDGDLVFYNEPAEASLGRRYEEEGALAASELAETFQTRAEDGSNVLAEDLPINIALNQRRPDHKTLRVRGMDGDWRVLEVTAFPIEGQAGRHLGAVVFFWEVDR